MAKKTGYQSTDSAINKAKKVVNWQKESAKPGNPMPGYLGMDDLDRMRRRTIK